VYGLVKGAHKGLLATKRGDLGAMKTYTTRVGGKTLTIKTEKHLWFTDVVVTYEGSTRSLKSRGLHPHTLNLVKKLLWEADEHFVRRHFT